MRVGAGVFVGARLGGLGPRDAWTAAAALNSRGIMGIVLGLVALEHGIIGRKMFVALAALGVFTALLSGPLLRWSARGRPLAGEREVEAAREP
jgi:Kef-type K+ transport system membrane component KefB